jgi:hypothetical protein
VIKLRRKAAGPMGEEYSDKGEKPDEIEITPEMTEAGTRELCSFNRDYEDDADAVARIYRAMLSTRPDTK